MSSAQKPLSTCPVVLSPSLSTAHTLGFLAFPTKPAARWQGSTRNRACGRRERLEHASPGKGETHWKSRLGVSVSTVTGESLHVYQCSFMEITHSTLRTDGPGYAGGPKVTRDPLHRPSHRADEERARSTCLCTARQAHRSPQSSKLLPLSSSLSPLPHPRHHCYSQK